VRKQEKHCFKRRELKSNKREKGEYMRKIIFFMFLISSCTFLSSCSCNQKSYLLKGKTAEIKDLPLINIKWYNLVGDNKWEIVKSWDTNDSEMETVRQLLLTAESEGEVLYNKQYTLILLFCDGNPDNLKLKEISFELREGEERHILFTGSAGASYPLGNLLSKYRFEERNLELSPERRDIIRQSKEAQLKEVEALKKKEREKEANQPSQKLSE
jgi:hypothetical protein